MTQRNRIRAPRRGFTLLEMLAVVAIMVTLIGIGGYYYLKQAEESKRDAARIHVKSTLTQACEAYFLKHDSNWPPSLEALLVQDELGGPYLKTEAALRDPWGNPYRYDPNGTQNGGRQPDIWAETAAGPIGNWMLR
jgi:general secretion pathway protein G